MVNLQKRVGHLAFIISELVNDCVSVFVPEGQFITSFGKETATVCGYYRKQHVIQNSWPWLLYHTHTYMHYSTVRMCHS